MGIGRPGREASTVDFSNGFDIDDLAAASGRLGRGYDDVVLRRDARQPKVGGRVSVERADVVGAVDMGRVLALRALERKHADIEVAAVGAVRGPELRVVHLARSAMARIDDIDTADLPRGG